MVFLFENVYFQHSDHRNIDFSLVLCYFVDSDRPSGVYFVVSDKPWIGIGSEAGGCLK